MEKQNKVHIHHGTALHEQLIRSATAVNLKSILPSEKGQAQREHILCDSMYIKCQLVYSDKKFRPVVTGGQGSKREGSPRGTIFWGDGTF